MTQEEVRELLDTLMIAVSKLVDVKLGDAVKSEICRVRLVDSGNVYVRSCADIKQPTHETPTSVSELDDGDIRLVNISGHTLVAGDGVEVIYTTTIDDGVIVRKLVYSPVDPGGEGHGVPSDTAPEMDGIASAGQSLSYARGDHRHPSNIHKLAVSATMTNQEIEDIMNS